jgi:acyl carrier protein
MEITRDQIKELIFRAIVEYQTELETPMNVDGGEQTRLFGADAPLDSLGLVSLIVLIEEKLEDEYGLCMILADEKAMSRRTSPFSRISYLIDYILELINEENNR